MSSILEEPLAILGIVLALLLVGGFSGLKIGKALQSSSDSKALSEARKNVTSATQTITTLNSKLEDVNKQTTQAQAQAKAQALLAEQEKKQLAQQTADQAKAETAWQKKLADAEKKPGCKTLEEKLCDSVMDY